MKFIKFLIVTVVLIVAIGFGAYHYGTKFASDKLVKTISTELEDSGELKEVKKVIESDPELKGFIEDGKTVDSSKLPFTTKEEATKVLIKKIGISELNNIRVQMQEGTASKQEILKEIEGKLTEEEMQALKVIAYKELYK